MTTCSSVIKKYNKYIQHSVYIHMYNRDSFRIGKLRASCSSKFDFPS